MPQTTQGMRKSQSSKFPIAKCNPPLHGYTLVELLATMAVAVILLTIAVPSLHRMLINYRMSAAVNEFAADLQLGRNEAVKRWRNIVICPSADGANCGNPAHWHAGWVVFADNDNSKSLNTGDEIIRRHGTVPKHLKVSSPASRPRVSYTSQGTSAGSNIKVTFCDELGIAQQRQVIISNEGRVRVEKVSLSCGS